MAESVGGKWDPLGGCGGGSECEGGLPYLLLVGAGFGPAKVPLRFGVGQLRCRCVEVLVCCS